MDVSFEWMHNRIEVVLNGYTYLLYGFMISKMDIHLSNIDKLLDRLRDTEEKVRLETVRTVCEAATEDLSCVSDKVQMIM